MNATVSLHEEDEDYNEQIMDNVDGMRRISESHSSVASQIFIPTAMDNPYLAPKTYISII